MVALSRSSSPTRPISCERLTDTPGITSRSTSAACTSMSANTGEKTAETRYCPDAVRGYFGRRPADLLLVELGDDAPVELVAAVTQVAMLTERVTQPVRPVGHRRQRRGSGQPEPHRGGRSQALCVHHRVAEVGGADPHQASATAAAGDFTGINPREPL
jgi:hypothetical protein